MSDSEADFTVESSSSLMSFSSSDLAVSNLETIEGQSSSDFPTQAPEDDSPMAPASQRVGLNHDILHILLAYLKDLYGSTDGMSWKQALVPLLVVNKSFFLCGADLLWNTMDSLQPAFKLLPWFKTPYVGLEAHAYSSCVDWKRFQLYASRIKSFTFHTEANWTLSTPYFVQLVTLPGRPDPLFPTLQSIEIAADVFKGSPILFILVGPSLQSLDVQDPAPESHLPNYDHVLSILPRLSTSCPDFRILKYYGVFEGGFVTQLSKISSITSLQLTFSSEGDWRWLRELRSLRLLDSLTIVAPFFNSMSKPSLGAFANHGGLHVLKSLAIEATEYQLCLIARTISPRKLRDISLTFLRAKDIMPFYVCLGLCISANPLLSQLRIVFTQGVPNIPPPILRSSHRTCWWPATRDACDSFIAAVKASKGIQSLVICDIPWPLAALASPQLLSAIPCWSELTRLNFNVAFRDLEEREPLSTPPFPALTFLASTVRKHFLKLEELEYHFEKDLVAHEDLTGSLKACENELKAPSSAAQGYTKGHHRLRRLHINTGNTSSELTELELPVSRKIEIATFLDRLFPTLEVIGGSASEVWGEIGAWVKSYQDQRAHFVAQVEDMFASN